MVLSLLLGVAGITGQIVASRRPIVGWTISLLNQPLWIALALATHQYGLLLLTPGYVAAAAINLRRAVLRSQADGDAQTTAVRRRGTPVTTGESR